MVNRPQAKMTRQQTRSSRELQADALEAERNQQENELRSQSLEAQIAALRAQQNAAENEATKYRKEKEARQQAAREQSFHETCSKAQEALRSRLADEVYTRVTQMIDDPETWRSLEAVAQGDFTVDQAKKLKVMLWEAIAGDDHKFTVDAAAKILDRSDALISDADVESIKSSDACLQLSTEDVENLLVEKKSHADISDIEDSAITARPFEYKAENTEDTDTVVVKNATMEESSNLTNNNRSAVGSRISHKAMTELEEEETSGITAKSSNIRDDQVSTSSILSPVSPRSEINDGFDIVTPRADLRKSSTPKKRKSKDRGNPTNRDGSPRAIKKSRGPGEGSSSTSQRADAFIENSKFISFNGCASIDFRCSACVKLVEKDARISTCLHLYHNDCLKTIRGGVAGKQAQKTKCHYVGCGEEIGTALVLANKALREMKKTYGVATNEAGAGDLMDEDHDS